jgi:predicted metal-dependent hydrolase
MIIVLILLVINFILFYNTTEPRELVEVKEKYRILREHIQETDHTKFKVLTRVIPITGMKRMSDSVGSNTNKGDEIVICLDGKVNEIFHVLIHELAHSTVKEYSHSDEFWKNYTELRNLAVDLGIYEQIPERTKFCGQHIQDK